MSSAWFFGSIYNGLRENQVWSKGCCARYFILYFQQCYSHLFCSFAFTDIFYSPDKCTQPTRWLHLCSWHNNHKYGHELQRVESGFAEVPLSLLFKTALKQLELWSKNCFWTHCCSQAKFKWLYLWLQAIYHVKLLGANDSSVKCLWVIRDAFKANNLESHLKKREDAWLIM